MDQQTHKTLFVWSVSMSKRYIYMQNEHIRRQDQFSFEHKNIETHLAN